MTDIDRVHAYGRQLEAARELTALLQQGLLLDLPVMNWQISTGASLIVGSPDVTKPDTRTQIVEQWAAALEVHVESADTSMAVAYRGPRESVTIILTTDPKQVKP